MAPSGKTKRSACAIVYRWPCPAPRRRDNLVPIPDRNPRGEVSTWRAKRSRLVASLFFLERISCPPSICFLLCTLHVQQWPPLFYSGNCSQARAAPFGEVPDCSDLTAGGILLEHLGIGAPQLEPAHTPSLRSPQLVGFQSHSVCATSVRFAVANHQSFA